MIPDVLVRLLAEETRMRVAAAIALGATTPTEIAEKAGVPSKDAQIALRRLREHGLVTEDPGPRIDYAALRRSAAGTAGGTGRDGTGLHPFVRDGRLHSLPAHQGRRRAVLEHVAASFEPDATYDERTVNDRLRSWCEGGEVDHVAVRRHLIDMRIMHRAAGRYSRSVDALPARDAAERSVTALGLD